MKCSKKDLFILMNEFEQESHEQHTEQSKATMLIKLKLFFSL